MTEAAHPAFDKFVETVAKLRSPDGGCSWNRAQTHETISSYLIEEAYEAYEAVQTGDTSHLREELGDVLLQVVLHSQIATDAGEFTIDDVCADIDAKMIRRHPHVFGDAKATNANEVADLWEQVKLAEKAAAAEAAAERAAAQNGACGTDVDGASEAGAAQYVGGPVREQLLDSVPIHFPALLQAEKISRAAAAAGFEWDTVDDVWEKVAEERAELLEAYAAAPKTPDGKVLPPDGVALLPDGEVLPPDGVALLPDGEVLPPDGVELAADNKALLADGQPAPDEPSLPVGPDAQALVSAVQLEFGDLLFALVNVARKMGIDAEEALRASNAKFRRRFAKVEQGAWDMGLTVDELSLDQMEEFWQQAKRREQ